MNRCTWVPANDELYIKYHDEQWGKPVRDDQELFAKLMLDAFQAGLSWRTILYKMDNFMQAFDNFDPHLVSKYDEAKVEELMHNEGIVRYRAKIMATIHNAKLMLEQFPNQGDFTDYLWSFVGGKTIVNHPTEDSQIGATSTESDAMSADLKKRGWKFMGSTVCYAFMQGVGLVDDHLISCCCKGDERNRSEYS